MTDGDAPLRLRLRLFALDAGLGNAWAICRAALVATNPSPNRVGTRATCDDQPHARLCRV